MLDVLCWTIKDQFNEPEGWWFYTPAKSDKRKQNNKSWSASPLLPLISKRRKNCDKQHFHTCWKYLRKIWLEFIWPSCHCDNCQQHWRKGETDHLKLHNYMAETSVLGQLLGCITLMQVAVCGWLQFHGNSLIFYFILGLNPQKVVI